MKSADANNLKVYPNPTTGQVNLEFRGYDGETAMLQVMDINGRLIHTDYFGKLYNGNLTHTFDLSELSSGVYIVNVSSDSGVKRVTKLIITK